MTRGRRFGVIALFAVACAVACDPRACLAYSPLFGGLRPELVNQCCSCLASHGTSHPGAACAESFIGADGGLTIFADSGPAIPVDAGPVPEDNDAGEVPCLCGDDFASCQAALTTGVEIVVTGACISQGASLFTQAPCESACKGVITFAPLSTAEPQ